mmetsp:Transcript_114881/g.199023  ORF Transcript_114881/g.199023 Transcript_114881/m.199023 type:complete len:280 (+) Transcript_114881:106-945(+)
MMSVLIQIAAASLLSFAQGFSPQVGTASMPLSQEPVRSGKSLRGEASNTSVQHGFDLLRLLGHTHNTPEVDAQIAELEQAIASAGHTQTEPGSVDAGELSLQTNAYDQWARRAPLKTVCEVGFNAGHGALRFLSQSNAHVYEFDIGVHAYSHVAADFLAAKFPGRLTLTWGDSTKTLPQFHAQHPDVKCDLIIVDGGHSLPVATADLLNFVVMASASHILVIDDTYCNAPSCVGPTSAWQNLIAKGCIQEVERVPMGPLRGFSFGKYTPCSAWRGSMIR